MIQLPAPISLKGIILTTLIWIVPAIKIAVQYIEQIQNSTSSTAAISYLFLPFNVIFSTWQWMFLGLAIFFFWKALFGRHFFIGLFALTAMVFSLVLIEARFSEGQERAKLIELVKSVRRLPSDEKIGFLKANQLETNKYALGIVLEDKNISEDHLRTIVSIQSPELHKAMSGEPELMGQNRKGLAVFRLVASHPNVTTQVLGILTESKDPYVLGDVVANTKVRESDIRKIYELYRGSKDAYLIEWGAARNNHTPKLLLIEMSKSQSEYTRAYVASNTSTPAKTLAVLATDVQTFVRIGVSRNPNCPRELLEKLANDPESRVANSAKFGIKRFQKSN